MSSHTNLELKARCRDLARTRALAHGLATRVVGVDRQVDTYFHTDSGRLKLRESTLSGAELVPYLRGDVAGPRRSDYRVIPVEDGRSLAELLGRILGIHRVVRKQREILLYENVRIHLDRVEGLGEFVELEAVFDGSEAGEAEQRGKLAFLRRELGIAAEDLVAGSYEGLIGPEPAPATGA